MTADVPEAIASLAAREERVEAGGYLATAAQTVESSTS
jgi:hypothetical protein